MDRRKFLTQAGGAAAVTLGGSHLIGEAAAATGKGFDGVLLKNSKLGQESSKLFLKDDGFKASTVDRLPLEWSKRRFKLLQEKLTQQGYDGAVLTDQWNVMYFTGLFHTTTERMIHVFIPAKGNSPIWFYPTLDQDLIRTWWYEDGEEYFDWHDVAGAFPNQGKVFNGPKHDLWKWLLEGLKKRGYAGKKLGVDKELVPSSQSKVVEVLKTQMTSVGNICMDMRVIKTPEELALMRRAYRYFDQVHAYARDLLLTYGTDLTDNDISTAATKYGVDLIMADIQRDGAPHTAVGFRCGINCRVGQATGYPHPNQFHHNKVRRGTALQISGGIRLGGIGGELYRPYMIGPLTDHMKKIWTSNRDACVLQKEVSRAGVKCSEVAYQIHKLQVGHGVQKWIYHRPAHGSGWEGHQPPYLALGDHTVLQPGMCFSVEPGLFDPVAGIGANGSDTYVVMPEGPSLQMSRLPWSEDWGLIKI